MYLTVEGLFMEPQTQAYLCQAQTYLYVTNQLEMHEHVGTVETTPRELFLPGNRQKFSLMDKAAFQRAKMGIQRLLRNPAEPLFRCPAIDGHARWVDLSYHDLLVIRWFDVLDWDKAHPGVIDAVRLDRHPFVVKQADPDTSVVKPESEPQSVIKIETPKSKPKSKHTKDKQYYQKLDLFE